MRAPGQRGVVIALGATQTLAWASSTYLPAILAAPIARDLDVSRATVFGAFSISLLVMAACGPLVGRAIDRAGGRNLLMWSNLVLAAGLVMLGMAHHVLMLFAAWCILGAGMAMGLYDAAFAALVRLYGADARRPITGITLIAGFASTVGWPLSAYMDAEIGWRAACFVWAALHLVIALPMHWKLIPAVADAAVAPLSGAAASAPAAPVPASPGTAVPDSMASGNATPATATPDTEAQDTATSVTATPGTATLGTPQPAPAERAAHRRRFALLGIYFASTAFVTSAYASHLPGLLTVMGAGAAGAVFAAALLGPAQVAARLAEFGIISRYKVHALVTARAATALHPLACVLLAVFGGPPMLAAVFALLHGAGNGMITIAKGTLPLALFGPAGYGLTQGWLGVGARVMQAAAPYAFGLVLDDWGGHAALAISAALSLLALGVLFALKQESV